MHRPASNTGIVIALIILVGWLTSTILLMHWQVNFTNPLLYFFVLLQMHLYTGLFITAHDAMHGTISSNRTINNGIGYSVTFLYAAFWYPKLYKKHHRHHKHVHTGDDPDYHQGGFVTWYISFIRNYLAIWQVVLMAILFNVLKIWIPQLNLILFWVVPSLLSTVQLFYFGTYLPHKGEHSNQHQSGSQHKNHLAAFLSCYFFGYHYEHHDSPGTPWWLLWKIKGE
ncbi:fatty acid desaturase [Mucilaginibacter sp. PPCGB 2223]|uniref:fatty acid desaturase n=1 Tax=Mucilaginibacter sp. PPCGB 2223 TaxID=1886027 RepID=UPI0008263AF0|nr:fatty acid desaturase [Mucilaginibacter sp. PPCGB 2223]OCX51301.1 fatty acid desaturase [Mucilaginibacter sp. PPCGB 2223]